MDRRYLLFGFNHYYPQGGLGDQIGTFDTIEQAMGVVRLNVFEMYILYDRIEGREILLG